MTVKVKMNTKISKVPRRDGTAEEKLDQIPKYLKNVLYL